MFPKSTKRQQALEPPGYTLAHLSDIHLPTAVRLGFSSCFSKRLIGYINWQRRQGIHTMDCLNATIADLAKHSFDHIALTGDLTNLSFAEEFTAGRHWLENLAGNDYITFVPGNHDAYVEGALGIGLSQLRPWLADGAYDQPIKFPSVRFRGPLALISLSSAIATPPFMATGQIGIRQLSALETLLPELANKGWIRVILLHHPPEPLPYKRFRRLTDSSAFLDLLARQGAELVLSGHHHRFDLRFLPGPDRSVPNLWVGSASSTRQEGAKRPGYGLITFSQNPEGQPLLGIRQRALCGLRFEDYETYSLPLPAHAFNHSNA